MSRTNCLLIDWAREWRERKVEFAYTTLRIEGVLSVGAAKSGHEADRLADGQLAINAALREEISVEIEPTGVGDVPGIDFQIGDYLADVNGSGPERVVSRSLKQSGDYIDHSIKLKDIWHNEQDRFDATLKKMVNGTGRGTMGTVATPVSVPYKPKELLRLKEEIRFEQESDDVIVNTSRNVPVRIGGKPTVVAQLETPLTTAGELTLYHNGAAFDTMALPTGMTQIKETFEWKFNPDDLAKTAVSNAGAGGTGLVVAWWFF